ncbi:2-oxo acid dehydrogenase subunit E2 [Phytoactinopolyspora mesophila]|uniref:Dehydrogenase n=1 Tax=Phytoactinopolyspora mesophila TaxID=2650750 RepID=A0A7K3M8T2_9ACTN|nr:2-oxo acid dehydrogenase subunit E2 [Phytoactinopolyspora mesophila]NDL59679.1 dehydrogenase [Phytoactinopolyspora mesophila]
MTSRRRQVEFRPFPARRRLLTAAMRVGRTMVPIHGLVEADVTTARRMLREQRPRLSFSAYVVACVARAAAMHPEVHAYRDWRGRLVLPHHVDVAVLIEEALEDGPVPVAHLVRDADVREVTDISSEIRDVQAGRSSSSAGAMFERAMIVARIPGAVPLFMRVMRRSVRMHERSGSVAVSPIGMFAGGGGHGIGAPTMLTLNVMVGGLSERPRVVDGKIEVRTVVDLTITVDHNVVDGAPAARFAASFRSLLESTDLLAGVRGS